MPPKPEQQLAARTREELLVIAKRLHLKRARKLSKDALIQQLLQQNKAELRKAVQLKITWWDRRKNSIYGWSSILGLLFTVYGYYATSGGSNEPKPAPSQKPRLVSYIDGERHADDIWSVAQTELSGLLINESDVPATNVVVSIAVNPGDGEIKDVTILGDVAHRITNRGCRGEAVRTDSGCVGREIWLKSVTFSHFPPRAEVTIAVDALATNFPPGFPRFTSILCAEGGPARMVTQNEDEATGKVKWQAFIGGDFIIEKAPDGSELVVWNTVRWEDEIPIPPQFRVGGGSWPKKSGPSPEKR